MLTSVHKNSIGFLLICRTFSFPRAGISPENYDDTDNCFSSTTSSLHSWNCDVFCQLVTPPAASAIACREINENHHNFFIRNTDCTVISQVRPVWFPMMPHRTQFHRLGYPWRTPPNIPRKGMCMTKLHWANNCSSCGSEG